MNPILLKLAGFVYYKLWSIGLWTPRDRQVLTREVFKFLSNQNLKVLFVGVQKYTKSYEKYFVNTHLESLDTDPLQASWGFKMHHVCSLQELSESKMHYYDVIIMNGVIGYGLNVQDDCEQVILACSRLLTSKGRLILGVNPSQMGQVQLSSLSSLKHCFHPTLGIRDSSHVIVTNEVFSSIQHHFLFYIRQD